MSSDELLVRRGQELYLFLRGEGVLAAEDLLTEDFVGHLTDGLPLGLGGDYRGRADMMTRGWGRVGQTFDMHPEVDTIYPVGPDLLIGRGHYVGVTVTTRRSVRAAFAHFWGLRDRRFASVYQVTDSAAWARALEA